MKKPRAKLYIYVKKINLTQNAIINLCAQNIYEYKDNKTKDRDWKKNEKKRIESIIFLV